MLGPPFSDRGDMKYPDAMFIDPGGTTGIATYRTGEGFNAWQTTDVEALLRFIENRAVTPNGILVVGIEDYLSSGHLTKDAKSTLLLIGQILGVCSVVPHTLPVLHPPQKRLHRLGRARHFCESRGIAGPHSWDALAHLVVLQGVHL